MTNEPGNASAAYSYAIDLLSRQDRSEKELFDKLIKKGFEKAAADTAIKKLKEKHYIDDVRMASRFLSAHLSQQSLTQLKFKLIKKGIGSDDLVAAIDEVCDEAVDDSESLTARQACAVLEILKKKKFDPADPSKDKILASIARKGFSYDVIREGLIMYEQQDNQ
ncbi:MAG: recombination regulator RecX [Lachnospiraceae bacterium]|nr:recombination regulator RecX [Lachnospiraceae bacterium]